MSTPAAEKIKLSDICERIASRIGPSPYRTWFGETAQFRLNGDGLDVVVPNGFVGRWIETNYLEHIVASAREVLGPGRQIGVRIVQAGARLEAAPAPTRRGEPAAAPAARRPRPGRAISRPQLRGRLEDFVVGPCNELAYSAACNLVREPGRAFKLLVVHGGCGLGKTHLLQGICNRLSEAHPGLEWRYLSGEQFTNEFIAAVRSGRIELFRWRFRNVDVLAIDDIHFLVNKKGTQKEFLHTFDAIDACGRAVVLSSDRHPRCIGTLSEPLVNRLISGMVTEIQPPDFATRAEIFRRRAARTNCPIPEEVVSFVATHVTRNVRELEGALNKLVVLASLNKHPVTLDLARLAVADHRAEPTRPPTPDEILGRVAERFRVRREQICSRCRDRTVSLARAVGVFLIRRHTPLSFPEIARAIGNKNHSTVLMATQRVERLLRENAAVTWRTSSGTHQALLSGLLEELEQELTPPAAG